MVVVFAVLAVWERLGGIFYLKVGEGRWCEVERGRRDIGYVLEATLIS